MNDEPSNASLVINEIYTSIQGESTRAGLPCVFIRLTGCDLRCRWCDTEYAFYEGDRMPIAEIVARTVSYGLSDVLITGGEPLLQSGVADLCTSLIASGMTVMIETSGAAPITDLPEGVIRIMDIKCPGSGEVDKNHWSNLDDLRATDEVKFVIADRADYEWARNVVRDRHLEKRCPILFSPVFGECDPKDLAAWIIADMLSVRLQMQLHKFIWHPEERGV